MGWRVERRKARGLTEPPRVVVGALLMVLYLPILNLAGPITGLVIQPLIGAISDRTWHPRWGRRRPYITARS